MPRKQTPAQKFAKRLERLVAKFPLKLRNEWIRYLGYGATVAYVVVGVLVDGFQPAVDIPAILGGITLTETGRAGVKPAHRR